MLIRQASSTIKPPNPLLTLSEIPRSVLAAAVSSRINQCMPIEFPLGNGHPVLVIPGFAGSDKHNKPLIDFISSLGFYATGWNMGRNMGHGLLDPDILTTRVNELYNRTGQKVTLLGHSLGGVYAREIAKLWPHEVDQVITLASPFGEGRDKASHLNYIYKKISPHLGKDDDSLWATSPPVPTTAVYSRSDGVLDWRIALQQGGHKKTENIEVYSSHNGIPYNASVWYLLADRLSQNIDDWQPFHRKGWRKLAYPKPAWQAWEQR